MPLITGLSDDDFDEVDDASAQDEPESVATPAPRRKRITGLTAADFDVAPKPDLRHVAQERYDKLIASPPIAESPESPVQKPIVLTPRFRITPMTDPDAPPRTIKAVEGPVAPIGSHPRYTPPAPKDSAANDFALLDAKTPDPLKPISDHAAAAYYGPTPYGPLPTDRESILQDTGRMGPTFDRPMVPFSKLADTAPAKWLSDVVGSAPEYIPGAPAALALANSRFGKGFVGATTPRVNPDAPVSLQDAARSLLTVPEGLTTPGGAATLGLMAVPGVGPLLGATMIPEQVADVAKGAGSVTGSLLGGDPETAGAETPEPLMNAAMLAMMGRHAIDAKPSSLGDVARNVIGAAPRPGRPFEYGPPDVQSVIASSPKGSNVVKRIRQKLGLTQEQAQAAYLEAQAQQGQGVPNDRANGAGIPGEVGVRQEPVEAGPLEAAGGDAAGPGRDVQAPEAGQEPLPGAGRVAPGDERIQPETDKTIAVQTEMVAEGKKPAVLIPAQTGQEPPAEVPPGLAREDTPAGTIIFDPSKVSPGEVQAAGTTGKGLGDVLGMGVAERPSPSPDNRVVTLRGADGTEKMSAEVAPGQMEQAVAAAEKAAGKGDTVGVARPQEVVASRQGALAEAAAAKQTEFAHEATRAAGVNPTSAGTTIVAELPDGTEIRMNGKGEVHEPLREDPSAGRGGEAGAPQGEGDLAGAEGRGPEARAGEGEPAGPAAPEVPEVQPGAAGVEGAPVAPRPGMSRKEWLDRRALAIEERRDLQARLQGGGLSPKAAGYARDELRVIAADIAAADRALGYGPNGPTADQVAADLKARHGQSEFAPQEVAGEPREVPPEVAREGPVAGAGGEGAVAHPEDVPAPEPLEGHAGKPQNVWLDPKRKIETRYRLIPDSRDILASHDEMSFAKNQGYPHAEGAQNRDRATQVNQAQVMEMGKGVNPEMFGRSFRADSGAPIVVWDPVRGRWIAETNGRVMGVNRMYNQKAGEGYRAHFSDPEVAADFGIDPKEVARAPRPIIVRERTTPLSEAERPRYIQDTNKGAPGGMMAVETAASDARLLDSEMMRKYDPGESGKVDADSNMEFIRDFMDRIIGTDRGDFVDRNGELNQNGKRRIENAILAKAYGFTPEVEKALDATDSDVKNLTNAMMLSAPRVAKTMTKVQDGQLHGLDYMEPVRGAISDFTRRRELGLTVDAYAKQAQNDMFRPMTQQQEEAFRFLEAHTRSPKRVAQYLESLANALESFGDPTMQDMFDPKDPPTLESLYRAGKEIYDGRLAEEARRAAELAQRKLDKQQGLGLDEAAAVPGGDGQVGAGAAGAGGVAGAGPVAEGEPAPGGERGGGPGGDGGGGLEPLTDVHGQPRTFAYSSGGKGVGRDPYAERTGRQQAPVRPFQKQPRPPTVPPATGPLDSLVKEDLAPSYRRLKDGVQQLKEDVHTIFSATSVGDAAKKTADIIRKNYAQRDFRDARVFQAIKPVRELFDKMRPADRMRATIDFIGGVETQERGKPSNQPTPELKAAAATVRAILDHSYEEIVQYGKDATAGFIEGYFPHLYKVPEAAGKFAHEWYERRSAEGPKTFTHRRYYELLDDALKAGLELRYDNPADLVRAHVAQVQHYLMQQKLKYEGIENGTIKFWSTDKGNPPPDWDIIHPGWGVIYGDPHVLVGEAVTKRFRVLEDIARDLGIKDERLPGVGGEFGRAEYGGTAGAGGVVTRVGSPVGVKAHEVGHILDSRYKLMDELTKSPDAAAAVNRELRALASLRYESKGEPGVDAQGNRIGVSKGYRDYVMSSEEKIANFLDAYVAEPSLVKDLAPVTLGQFRSFLSAHPELHRFFEFEEPRTPMADGTPRPGAAGVELEERVTRVPVKGKVIAGHWVAPRPVVRLVDRTLTPGLQGKVLYRGFRNITNAMNQIQLGFSGFHAVFTGLDSVTGRVALGIQQGAEALSALRAGDTARARDFGGDALSNLNPVAAALAPVKFLREGSRIREMARNLPVNTAFETMPPEIQNLLKAGGGVWQDTRYSTGAVDGLVRSWQRGNLFGSGIRLPGAVLEMAAKPVMEHWVPNIKVGMFAEEAAFELKRLGPDASSAEISHALGRIWDSVENRMGQLRYDNLMWDRTMKDLGQVIVRSLGWNLGDIREIGGGIFDTARARKRAGANEAVEGAKRVAQANVRQAEADLAAAQATGKKAAIAKAETALRDAQEAVPDNLNDPVFTRRMAYAMAMPLTVGTMGAMYYFAKHGTLPTNVKDVFAIPTGGRNKDGSEERVFLPTYAKDVYAWSHDPVTTATHKLSPGLSVAADIARGEDYAGVQTRNPDDSWPVQGVDSLEHAIRQMVPMSARQFMQSRFPGSHLGLAEAALGVTRAPANLSRSQAEQGIIDYLRRSSGGVKTKEEAEKRTARSEAKALLRGGHDEEADAKIEEMIANHQMPADEASRKRLYAQASRDVLQNALRTMPPKDALRVFQKATPEERQRWADAFRDRWYGSIDKRTGRRRAPAWRAELAPDEVEAMDAKAEALLPAD